MNTAGLLEKIRDLLATDEAFVSYCVKTIGSAPTIHIGFDEEEAVKDDSFPFICVVNVSHSSDIMQKSDNFTLQMLAGARRADLGADVKTVETSSGSVQVKTRTNNGRLEAENLREEVVGCLYRSYIGRISINSEPMSHTFHSKYYSPFSVTVEVKR